MRIRPEGCIICTLVLFFISVFFFIQYFISYVLTFVFDLCRMNLTLSVSVTRYRAELSKNSEIR